jgi:hypothetical protein
VTLIEPKKAADVQKYAKVILNCFEIILRSIVEVVVEESTIVLAALDHRKGAPSPRASALLSPRNKQPSQSKDQVYASIRLVGFGLEVLNCDLVFFLD